jgi:hypothetical protein
MVTSNTQAIRRAGIAFIVGAGITALGGAVSQVAQTSAAVSDQTWSYPWSSDAFVPITLLWASAHALIIVGLLAFRRSGLAGATRTAGVGLALAVLGTVLLLAGEVASVPIRDHNLEDTGPAIVGGLFGLATLLSAGSPRLARVQTTNLCRRRTLYREPGPTGTPIRLVP